MAIYQYRLEFISHKSGHISAEIGGADYSAADALARLWQALGYHMRRDDMPIIYDAGSMASWSAHRRSLDGRGYPGRMIATHSGGGA